MFPKRVIKEIKEHGYKPGKPWFYVSGALTNLSKEERKKRKAFYEKIAKKIKEHGGFAYVPHWVTDPEKYPDVSPSEVYQVDKKAVLNAGSNGAVIAVVDKPSLGVGMEIEMAVREGVPVVLLHREGIRVSRLARGGPGTLEVKGKSVDSKIITVSYKDEEDAVNKIGMIARKIIDEGNGTRVIDRIKEAFEEGN